MVSTFSTSFLFESRRALQSPGACGNTSSPSLIFCKNSFPVACLVAACSAMAACSAACLAAACSAMAACSAALLAAACSAARLAAACSATCLATACLAVNARNIRLKHKNLHKQKCNSDNTTNNLKDQFVCPACDKTFSTKGNFKRHITKNRCPKAKN